jgi:hypothetical protein
LALNEDTLIVEAVRPMVIMPEVEIVDAFN